MMTTDPQNAGPKTWREKIRHAFAVDPPGPAEPTEAQREVVENLLGKIVARGMAQPAGIFLESWRPMGVLTGQGMQALAPFAGIVMDPAAWKEVANYLDRRGAIPWMLARLDELEAQREAGRRKTGDSGAENPATKAPQPPSPGV